MKLPFGKYRGALIEDLPDDYLDRLSTRDLRQPLRGEVMAERERRVAYTTAPACVRADLANEIVRIGYRELAKRFHPDKGGAHEDMVALGRAKDWLAERAGL